MPPSPMTLVGSSSASDATLDSLVADFQKDVATHLNGIESSKVVIASAWLISDITIQDLFARYTNVRPTVAAVDTLHLFPETLEVAAEMQQRYADFKYIINKPEGCETREDFVKKYGFPVELKDADFDKFSKIAPMERSLKAADAAVTITGRRCDQGNKRVELDVFEAGKQTFNPLAKWSWKNVCDYILLHSLPYNALHRRISVSTKKVEPRHRDGWAFKEIELDMPFFAYDEKELQQHGANVFVWKSFGDTHTSTVVMLHESERAGRFVGRGQTECGLHTRISFSGLAHGGVLVDRMVATDELAHVAQCTHTHEMTARQTCDFELIANGGFSPLVGFMTEEQYNSVLNDCRLPEQELFGLAVTLDTDNDAIQVGDYVLLTNSETGARGVLHVESKWAPDRLREGELCFGTTSLEHPAVMHLVKEKARFNIGGRIFGRALPERSWVTCKTPRQVRATLDQSKPIIFFQTRNPTHRAHAAMFLHVAKEYRGAQVIVNPIIGPSKSDDVPAQVRVQTYEALAKRLTHVKFMYLPYSMMVGGPRECLQHIIIRKNFGATGMIVGRDHAGCKDFSGKDFYGPSDAQTFVAQHTDELKMEMVPFKAMVYAEEIDDYVEASVAKEQGYTQRSISGTKFRKALRDEEDIPDWFAFPEVIAILRDWAREEKAREETAKLSLKTTEEEQAPSVTVVAV